MGAQCACAATGCAIRTRDSGRVAKRWNRTLARCVSDSVWSPKGKRESGGSAKREHPLCAEPSAGRRGSELPQSLVGVLTTESNRETALELGSAEGEMGRACKTTGE